MTGINETELRTTILDYMEKGFLDNIIDMFKHDEGLYRFIVEMIRDERVRVRLGATALVEELAVFKRESLAGLVPEIAGMLSDPNPTVRGDSAYLLGIIGHQAALPLLIEATRHDNDSQVREIAGEAIADIRALDEGGPLPARTP